MENVLTTLFAGVQKLDLELASKFDDLMSSFEETRFISIDKERLADSHEAWFFVNVEQKSANTLEGFSATKGVLTWPNSD